MDEKLEKLLLKIRKGATSSITFKQLQQVLDYLGGWTIEPEVFTIEARSSDLTEALKLKELGLQYNPTSRSIYASRDLSEDDVEKLENIRAELLHLPPIPSNKPPKVNAFYLESLGKVKGERSFFFLPVAVVEGAKGFSVTAPNGESFDLKPEPHYKGLQLYDFWPWLRKKTDFDQQVLGALGMEQHVPASQRTRENTGTCTVCFRNIKLRDDKIVLHGYNRPGWGYVVGNCPGTDFPPYELSDEGCRARLDTLKPSLKHAKQTLAAIESADVLIDTHGILGKKSTTYSKGSPGFPRLLDQNIYDAKGHIRRIEDEMHLMQTAIDNWELREPPLEVYELSEILRTSAE